MAPQHRWFRSRAVWLAAGWVLCGCSGFRVGGGQVDAGGGAGDAAGDAGEGEDRPSLRDAAPAGPDRGVMAEVDAGDGPPPDRAPDVTLTMPADVPPPSPDLPPLPPQKKANGARCAGGTECQSGHCSGEICCSAACTGRCQSCLAAHTGMADGTCAPVRAGMDPGNHCQASDVATCGLDGQCDGAGNCRNWPDGTTCRPGRCDDGAGMGSTATPAGTCNGSGAPCSAPAARSCGQLRCGTNACKARCNTSADCILDHYCGPDGACLASKANGALCSNNVECGSNICGGRCCARECRCSQPSATNLLRNPGFDQDLGRWLTDGAAVWAGDQDGDRCPHSGAVDLRVASDVLGFAEIFQCVPISAGGNYQFGGRIMLSKIPVEDYVAGCTLRFHASENCTGTALDTFRLDILAGMTASYDWRPFAGSRAAPPGAGSMSLECQAINDSLIAHVWLDMLYVSRSGAF